MNPKYLYFSINLFSFAIPFIFSFHPKASFSKKWKYVFPAILISASVFMVWNALFTAAGVWGLNPQYVTGIGLFGLPVEEIAFSFCIPYACLFTYFALNQLMEKDYLFLHQELITSFLTVILLIAGIYNIHKMYTATACLFTGFFLAYSLLKFRLRFMGRFYLTFAVLLVLFLLVNGMLMGAFIGEPIVWYNNAEILGIRLGTIPVESIPYGMLMVLVPLAIWEKLEEKY